MEYTNLNNLSMTGGDDFTDINSSLADAVFKSGIPQIITSSKTLTGTTTIKPTTDLVYIQSSTGLERFTVDATTNTLNNTVTNIQSGGTTKYSQNATTTTLTNTNLNIIGILGITGTLSSTAGTGTNSLSAVGTGGTNVLNGETNRIQVSGTDKVTISSSGVSISGATNINGATTVSASAITLQDNSTATHFLQSATSTNITNATINMNSGGVVGDKYRATATLTIIDNDEIRLRYRTANKETITATVTTLTNESIALTSATGDNTLTATLGRNVLNAPSNYMNASATNNTISANTYNSIQAGASSFNEFSVGTVQKLLTQTSDTTLNNTNTYVQSAGVPKISVVGSTNTTTMNNTITNIQSGASTKIQTTASSTYFDNTNTRIQSGAVDKITVNGTDTALTNTSSLTMTHPTTTLKSGANTKLLITGTDTTLTNVNMAINGGTVITGDTQVVGAFGVYDGFGLGVVINSTTGSTKLTTSNTTDTGINIENTNATTGGITVKTYGTSGDINLLSGRNIDLVGVLTHNTATVNPRRQYQLNYTNGGNSVGYGVEIIRAVDDPNNPYTTNKAQNGKTYIEIFCNGNSAAGYNATRISGYFISSGNSDAVSQSDFAISTYVPLENHFSNIMTGSTGTTYISFIFYLVGGFNYTIITDGKVGNYWNNIFSVAPYEQWALTSNITYNTGATATFAIAKVANTGADYLGVTASAVNILAPDYFNQPKIYQYTDARENIWKMTDSKMLSAEHYIGSPSTSLVPMVNFTKSAIRSTTTAGSSGSLNFMLDDNASNVGLRANIPFNCRVVGVEVNFDNDATPPGVSVRFQVYLGSTTALFSSAFLDTSALMIVPTTFWSTAYGNVTSCNPTTGALINAGYTQYGSWRCIDSSAGTPVTLNQEFQVIFYYQQLAV